ncbi:MAG TPA: DUF3488 and transglutaminase-like domain-containing protein, partial [Nocardioides sp.]|nr:DUF3488 and transglutaminase-like domain-containing protein [Nocardioides sp.]
ARDHLLRWGRPLGPRDDTPWSDSNPLAEAFRVGAGRIGISATALALVVAPLVPVLDLDVFGIGPGDGDDEIKIEKPIADMRRDLQQGEDVPLVRVTTDDPDPEYLRVAVLNRFTGAEWSSGNRVVTGGPDGDLPEPPGLSSSVPRDTYDYEVDVEDEFVSTWLPTQYPASSVVADGDWQYDPATLDFVADGDQTTAGMSYSMTAIEPEYGTTGEFFEDSVPSDVGEESLALPSGIPEEVSSWAFRATAGAVNDYERALLLQRWFREDGRFRYSLERAPEGTGGDTLEAFLSEDGRVGYCEQFASAMAVMARYVGIPSRVAVGFLSPTPTGAGEYVYSTDDLHAWPELYFAGAGWVRFEPTPSSVAETVPDYSRVAVDVEPVPTGSQASEQTDRPSASRPDDQASTAAPDQQGGDEGAGSDGGVEWGALLLRALAGLAVLAVLVLLALAPRAYRGVLRRRRLDGAPDDVWAELRATALDLELPWPDGRTPREIGTVIADRLGDPTAPALGERPRTGPAVHPPATEALDALITAVELQRYALPGRAPHQRLAERAETCIGSLLAGSTRSQRLRAVWLPRSLWQRRATTTVEVAEREPERV